MNQRRANPRRLIVCGVHATEAFLRAGRVQQLWSVNNRRLRQLLQLAESFAVEIHTTSPADLSAMVEGAVHQGVVAAVDLPEANWQQLLESPPPLLVALDGVSDPRNLGAVMRAVRAFGGGGVVAGANRNAPLSAVAVRASSGAAAVLPLYRVGNLRRALLQLRDAGCAIIGASEKAETVLAESPPLPHPHCWVFGGEGGGLRRLTLESCDTVLRIPTIAGEGGCLNVAAACAVCLSRRG